MLAFSSWTLLLLPAIQLFNALPAQGQSTALDPQLPSNLVECTTVDLTWSATDNNGSANMYFALIVSASNMGLNGTDEVITYLTRLNDTTSYEWQAAIEAGSNISLKVSDSAGNVGYSSPVVVQEGDASCLPTGQNGDGDMSANTASNNVSSTGSALSIYRSYSILHVAGGLTLACAIGSLIL